MTTPINLSVVVCTYNRCSSLSAALESVLAQNADGYEVIVVDNNSTDATSQVLDDFARAAPGRLRPAREERQGLSYARNTGIALSRGNIVAFMDDDVRAGPCWVTLLRESFRRYPEVHFVGGKVLPVWPATPPPWLTPRHWPPLALLDYGDEPFYVDAERPICLVGCNLAFRRETFEQVGLFDPNLCKIGDELGSVEDEEFERRIWQNGGRGLYEPKLLVYADVQPERLTKDYHRRWHQRRGQVRALMKDTPAESAGARFLDVPSTLYRHAISSLIRWAWQSVRRDEELAMWHESQVQYLRGYLGQRWRRARECNQHSLIREASMFAVALLSSKIAGNCRKEDGGGKTS